MFSASSLRHLRFPFSLLLMPVFWFALGAAADIDLSAAVLSFIALHACVYPASNGFNSYYDRDEGSIGGLERPPAVMPDLLWASLLLDVVGLLVALFVSLDFCIGVLIYGLFSKAYSHPAVRLKKYPIISLLVIGIFQGGFIFFIVYQAVTHIAWRDLLITPALLLPAALNTLMLLGSYPMTQIYQHDEDARRGDLTMSRLLGVQGTFAWTAVLFSIATAGLGYYFAHYFSLWYAVLLLVLLAPVLVFFLWWWYESRRTTTAVNYRNTMRLNLLAAFGTNAAFFIIMLLQQGLL